MSAHLGIKGRVKASVIDHEGNLVKSYPWQRNLLLDSGLDKIAEIPIVDLFAYAAKGTGITPTSEDGAGTISQTGDIITATGIYFGPEDVGKVVRWSSGANSGTVRRIIAYTNSMTVQVSETGDVASGNGTVYNVDQVALTTEVGDRTNSYSQVTGENGTTTVGNKRTLKRTFIFAAETADTTYNEVGFSDTADGDLNIRVKLASAVTVNGPVGLTPGQRLKLTYEMDIYVSPDTATAAGLNALITDSGQDMSSNKNASYIIETFATSRVALSGERDVTLMDLEPSYTGHMALSTNTEALEFNGNAQRIANVDYVELDFMDDYVAGEYFRDLIGTFELEDANRTNHRSLMLFNPETNNAILTYLFTANQKKDANHSLTLQWRKSWSRNLA